MLLTPTLGEGGFCIEIIDLSTNLIPKMNPYKDILLFENP
jgi:hypothetical protein